MSTFIHTLHIVSYMGVPKIRGAQKMDGENNGKPPIKMDDLGGDTTIFGNIHMIYYMSSS